MTGYRSILKKVGLVLVAAGIAGTAFMVYKAVNSHSYSSGICVFAVIAGIFLLRGSLGATRLVTCFSAFFMTVFIGCACFILIWLWRIDVLGFFVFYTKLNPVRMIVSFVVTMAFVVIPVWTYRQLRSEPVLVALEKSGRRTATPKLALGLGLTFVAMFAVVMHMIFNGMVGAGDHAVNMVRQRLGPDYHYAARSVQWNDGYITAVVVVYDEKKMKYVTVKWASKEAE